MSDYSDIINTKWPKETLRGKMNLNQRAKIFLPFSALSGYEDSLEQEKNYKEKRIILSNEEMLRLNNEIEIIQKDLNIGKSVFAEIIYFKPYFDTYKNMYLYEKGNNIKITGIVSEVKIGNSVNESYFVVNDVKIPLVDVSSLKKI